MIQRDVSAKQKPKPNLEYLRDKDRQIVRGKFIFHEVPGGIMSFNFKAYKGDDVQRYDLRDGEIYSIPLGVAKHLNKNCWYPIHAHVMDKEGRTHDGMGQSMFKIGQQVRRCSFQSLEFVDIEDLSPAGSPLVTVESV